MTTVSAVPDVSSWDNPPHPDPRGTIVPLVLERLRLGADAPALAVREESAP